MSMAAAVEVKGWCPGVLRPMQSGDGMIARVRPWGGAIGLAEAKALADAAERFGNGHIDLTRRANLQLRGLDEAGLGCLQDVVTGLGLVDRDARIEAVRNVMVAPLAGIDPREALDVRPLARALEEGLAEDAALHGLPSKFGFLVDGGGRVSIAGERVDIALKAIGQTVALGLDTRSGTRWTGLASPGGAVKAALAAARTFLGFRGERRRLRDLDEADFGRLCAVLGPMLHAIDGDMTFASERPLGVLSCGDERFAVGVAAAFGRLEARQLRRFATAAAEAGATDIRPSPWRSIYVGVRDTGAAHRLVEVARDLGLIVDAENPILRIDACPGAPACRSSSVDTRRTARLLAASAFTGSAHVSGCAKGCARSAPADLVLVGELGRYKVIRNGTTCDQAERTIDALEAGALFDV
jgi:precorrin-3B synthase